jgi:hypothetical protein
MRYTAMLRWLVLVPLMTISTVARGDFQTGTVTLFHLNGAITDRGACVRMSPAIPGSGWACVWKSNSLYKEIGNLLLTGYLTAKSCRVAWDGPGPDGNLLIVWAECS